MKAVGRLPVDLESHQEKLRSLAFQKHGLHATMARIAAWRPREMGTTHQKLLFKEIWMRGQLVVEEMAVHMSFSTLVRLPNHAQLCVLMALAELLVGKQKEKLEVEVEEKRITAPANVMVGKQMDMEKLAVEERTAELMVGKQMETLKVERITARLTAPSELMVGSKQMEKLEVEERITARLTAPAEMEKLKVEERITMQADVMVGNQMEANVMVGKQMESLERLMEEGITVGGQMEKLEVVMQERIKLMTSRPVMKEMHGGTRPRRKMVGGTTQSETSRGGWRGRSRRRTSRATCRTRGRTSTASTGPTAGPRLRAGASPHGPTMCRTGSGTSTGATTGPRRMAGARLHGMPRQRMTANADGKEVGGGQVVGGSHAAAPSTEVVALERARGAARIPRAVSMSTEGIAMLLARCTSHETKTWHAFVS